MNTLNVSELVQAAGGRGARRKLASLVALGSAMPWYLDDNPNVSACCTEKGFHISKGALNEGVVKAAFILLHEVCHYGFRHIQRGRAICKRLEHISHEDVNILADILINEALFVLTGWPIPYDGQILLKNDLYETFKVELDQTLEENAERLNEERKKNPQQQPQPKQGSGDNSLSDAEIDRMINQAKGKARQQTGGKGHGDGDASTAEETLVKMLGAKTKINWRSFLKGTLQGLGSGQTASFARASRRQYSGVVMAGKSDATAQAVLFCIDKSGSMNKKWCDESREIIADFLSKNATVEVWVAEFCGRLEKFYKATPRKLRESISPAGGTAFDECVAAYNKMPKKPAKVFILTDCDGDVEDVDCQTWGKDVIWFYYDDQLTTDSIIKAHGRGEGRGATIRNNYHLQDIKNGKVISL